jgi:predicted flap endonuclease-1-like 5' DNA nuclease
MREDAVRTAYRFGRLVIGLAALGLALGWLLLRRRGPASRPPRLHAVPPLPQDLAAPFADPRAAEPAAAADAAVTAEAATADPPAAAAERPAAAEPASGDPSTSADGASADGASAEGASAEGAVALPEGATDTAVGEGRAPDEDDLRRIRGVGPATEAMLHELGIRSYEQLAGLDADGRERVRVAVKDTMHRIEREDWAGQATELHRAKYGKDPLRPA